MSERLMPEQEKWLRDNYGHVSFFPELLTELDALRAERDFQANRAEEAEAAWTATKQAELRLSAHVERLREALEPFARADLWGRSGTLANMSIAADHREVARTVLAETAPKEGERE